MRMFIFCPQLYVLDHLINIVLEGTKAQIAFSHGLFMIFHPSVMCFHLYSSLLTVWQCLQSRGDMDSVSSPVVAWTVSPVSWWHGQHTPDSESVFSVLTLKLRILRLHLFIYFEQIFFSFVDIYSPWDRNNFISLRLYDINWFGEYFWLWGMLIYQKEIGVPNSLTVVKVCVKEHPQLWELVCFHHTDLKSTRLLKSP